MSSPSNGLGHSPSSSVRMLSSGDASAADSGEDLSDNHWLAAMANFASGQHNDSRDYSAATLKPIVSHIYPVFVLQYGLLMLVGAVANVLIGYHIMRKRLYRDVTHALVLNLVFSHCVQCFVVVPMTLTVLLVQNWILGQFLCYFLPMLQVSGGGDSELSTCHQLGRLKVCPHQGNSEEEEIDFRLTQSDLGLGRQQRGLGENGG